MMDEQRTSKEEHIEAAAFDAGLSIVLLDDDDEVVAELPRIVPVAEKDEEVERDLASLMEEVLKVVDSHVKTGKFRFEELPDDGGETEGDNDDPPERDPFLDGVEEMLDKKAPKR